MNYSLTSAAGLHLCGVAFLPSHSDYFISLKTVGLLVGLLVLASHVYAMVRPAEVQRFLTGLPRSQRIGEVLLLIDLIWAFGLAWKMDWGEFYYMQNYILILLPVFAYLTWQFVDEFLAVRALGILLLLAAAPLLDAAFLQPPMSRLLVVVLAYAWVVFGMLWVGQPHLLRDQIGWVNRSASRWKLAVGSGLVYGALLLLCALVWY